MGLISLAIKASVAKTAIKTAGNIIEKKTKGPVRTRIVMPSDACHYKNMHCHRAMKELRKLGFDKISTEAKYIRKSNIFRQQYDIIEFSIEGNSDFCEGTVFYSNDKVYIKYYELKY